MVSFSTTETASHTEYRKITRPFPPTARRPLSRAELLKRRPRTSGTGCPWVALYRYWGESRHAGFSTHRVKKTGLGLRDRTILSVGLQGGFRRAEIAGLTVGDFHMNRGYASLRVVRKGGKKGSLAMHPQAAQRIRDYRVAARFFPSLHWDL